ncbi:MAG TPA: thiamine-phosphate kinase, partial [Chloroflexota bacterium]
MTTVGELGEFRLIDRLAARLPLGDGVVVGIGDDTAALEPTPGHLLLATTDGQVEGVHFLRDGTPPRSLGHRVLASNLSDVAAMGGRPRWAIVALTLPDDLELAWLEQLYDGLAALASRHRVGVVGGNVARSPGGVVVDLTLLGEVRPERRLSRAGARPGEAVYVTGQPGEAAGGLELILRPRLRERLPVADVDRLLRAHWEPSPRVEEGQALAAGGAVGAMIDVSDGLAADLGHVLAASGVGATLDEAALPISPALRALEAAGGRPALELTLHGGEAYELSFTCRAAPSVAATRIGAIEAEPGLRLRSLDGTVRAL